MILPPAASTATPVVVAVVVSFNPDQKHFEELISAIAAQTAGVVIVDNGSDDVCAEWIEALTQRRDITYEPLAKNVGVAAAQNHGICVARQRGADYVLLMDHDSLPQENMVRRLLEVDSALRASDIRVGVVGPRIIDRRTRRSADFVRMRGGCVERVGGEVETLAVECDFLIASGSLIHLDILESVGGMNEGYFIDHIDTEWCFRLHAFGYRIYGVPAAKLLHSLGDDIVRIWLGRWRDVAIHSPIRDYYMCRNTVLMLRITPMERAWRWAHFCRLVQFVVFFSLSVAPRWRRLKLMVVGLHHGLLGRDGPFAGV